jgi:hypothetical protein
MNYLVTIAVAACVLTGVIGCAQGAGNAPFSSTDPTTSSGRSGQRATTAEQRTSSFHQIPVPKEEYRGGGMLECSSKNTESAIYDYALGIGEKASPVEQTRRRFSKRIEEGDKVEITKQPGGPTVGYYGEALRTVRVVRDGRVVALMFYKAGRGAKEVGSWTPMRPAATSRRTSENC